MHESPRAIKQLISFRSSKRPLIQGKSPCEVVGGTRYSYPAARAASLLEPKGTQAWIVVPPFGCELIESSPCILVSPSPATFIAVSLSKPEPRIAEGEVDRCRASPQTHVEAFYSTMLGGIAQGFL